MVKDFDGWNGHKKHIDAAVERPFYHTREIWWCSVGVNIGNELDGTGKQHDRPVLVIRPFNAETEGTGLSRSQARGLRRDFAPNMT